MFLHCRIQKAPSISILPSPKNQDRENKNADKDCAKLDNKRRKAEEAVKKTDVEYYTYCIRAERARVDWEISILRGTSLFQTMEGQRLNKLNGFIDDYWKIATNLNPTLTEATAKLLPVIKECNVQKDLETFQAIRRTTESQSEQLLPDFYCEHTTLAMNRDRRKQVPN